MASLLDGFEKCEKVYKAKIKSKWKAALMEFIETGNKAMKRTFPSKEEAIKFVGALYQVREAFNYENLFYPILKEACEHGAEEFVFPTVRVSRDFDTVRIERINRLATRDKEGLFKTKRFGYDSFEAYKEVDDGE